MNDIKTLIGEKTSRVILQKVNYDPWLEKSVHVSVLREDLVHPYLSGNKWRKLKYNVIDYFSSGKSVLVTFGGAYSNHLVAVSAASEAYGIKTVAIIRGEEVENDYIRFMKSNGVILHFISREKYRMKNKPQVLDSILDEMQSKTIIKDKEEVFIIPEGGANDAAVKGASEIMDEIPEDMDYIACACGTGATAAGISRKLHKDQKLIVVPVLKAEGFAGTAIQKLGGKLSRIIIKEDYHFGGYAKKNIQLETFCKNFSLSTGVPVEPVYTGKLFFAIDNLISKNYFKTGTKVTLIHTGGIFNFDF